MVYMYTGYRQTESGIEYINTGVVWMQKNIGHEDEAKETQHAADMRLHLPGTRIVMEEKEARGAM